MKAPSEAAEEQPVADDLIPCPNCQALNPRDARACAECDAILVKITAADARHVAAGALKRGYAWIAGVAWVYRAGAVAYAIVTLAAIVALRSREVPLGGGILVVGLTTLLTVLMLIGAMRVLFEPFMWTVIIASLATVVSIVHLVGPNPLGLMFLWSGLWAALLWAVFVPTRNFQQLMARHQDVYIMDHASRQTRRSLEGRTPRERHDRLVNAMRRAGQHAWKVTGAIGAVIVLASAIGTWTVVTKQRADDIDSYRSGFEAAWNDSDLSAIREFFPSEIRTQQSTRLERVADAHGWRPAMPRLDEGREREEDGRVWFDYECAGAPLSACWGLRGQRWTIVRLDLPAPPFEPVLERFLAAWHRSDPQAIVAFFSPENRANMLGTIELVMQRREWTTYPEIVETKQADDDAGGKRVELMLDGGQVAAVSLWYFRPDGEWGLSTLTFPAL